MLFNTREFAIFFSIVLVAYWLVKRNRTAQTLVLLAANGYFYTNLHWTFPIYLSGMICVGYLFGRLLPTIASKRGKKQVLAAGIVLLGTGLAYIKYSGLILGNIPGLEKWQASALHIIVPLGISYYTFSSIGYIVDVYREKVATERNFLTYAAYISFFPHILSGPIPSASTVLPQFSKPVFPNREKIEQSVAEIIWALFKKMVIAANVEKTVNYCYARHEDLNGSTLFLGIMLFNLYLYADFSAYSDIARACGRLMGIELAQNFKMPFFSRNPGEFWRRWHTSLRKWMLDYLYLPLGGNRTGTFPYIMSILFIFSFSGLWHGANMTFVCWGLLNGLYFIPYILTNKLTRYKEIAGAGRLLPSWKEALQIGFTFILTSLTRIFFRSPNIETSRDFIEKIFSAQIMEMPMKLVYTAVGICIPMIIFEWIQRERAYFLQLSRKHLIIRLLGYAGVILLIYFLHKKQNASEYYYFKF